MKLPGNLQRNQFAPPATLLYTKTLEHNAEKNVSTE
jgi:hypothetical protein